MKRIVKDEEPFWFESWKQNFQKINGRSARYKNEFSSDSSDGSDRRRRLRSALLTEQGYICCYCMKRISNQTSHIEHFWPKKDFPQYDLEYNNLFASCNGEGEILLDDEYCGHKKEDWWHAEMISPIDAEIEKIFQFTADGKIHAVAGRTTENIANEMIHNMGLDSYHLERNRRQAIEASEVFDDEDYSDKDIRDFIEYYSNKVEGKYVPYCMAILDCLVSMLYENHRVKMIN